MNMTLIDETAHAEEAHMMEPGHEDHSSDDAVHALLHEEEEVAEEIAEETISPSEAALIAEVGETILSAIEAVEESVTGITSGTGGLVTQIMNEILGTESPTPAPTVFVPEKTSVDIMIGKITDTVNTIAAGTGDVLNEVFNEPPTPAP